MQISLEQLLNLPDIFEQLLSLSDIKVLTVDIGEDKITFDIESTRGYATCHRCGQKATKFFEHGETIPLRHLPICDKDVYLYLRTKRYRCLNCDKHPTTTERLDWYDTDAKCTKAFAEFCLLALVNSTIVDVSAKYRISYDIVRGVLDRYVTDEVDWTQFKHLSKLGMDEISLLKGHRDFVVIVSTRDDQGNLHVLAVLKDRKKDTVVDFLKTIPENLRATVKEVCTDLYEGFINAAAEVLPQAEIIADRFHVTKLYRGGLDDLRKKEMKALKRILTKEEYAELKGAMWALRKNPDDLEPKELAVLEQLFKYSYEIRRAYKLREKLTKIFDTKQSPEAARRAIQSWIDEVKGSSLDCFDKFIAILEEHMEIVTNYFINRSNSGWVEGLNNKIKVLKRRCYGITNPVSLFRRIWLDLNGYGAFAH